MNNPVPGTELKAGDKAGNRLADEARVQNSRKHGLKTGKGSNTMTGN